MTDSTLADSISAHILSIMEMNQSLTALELEEQRLNVAVRSVISQRLQVAKEIKEARKLLDYCIDTNSDPVQTQLSYTGTEISKLALDKPMSTRQLMDHGLTVVTSGGKFL